MDRGTSRAFVFLGVVTTATRADHVITDLDRGRWDWHLAFDSVSFLVLAAITVMFARHWWTSDTTVDD